MPTPEKKYIQAIDSTLQSWEDLIEFCISSEFYKKCLEYNYSKKISAKMTLVWAYLLTFSYFERIKLIEQPEMFYFYTSNFIKELTPFRYNKCGYNREGRKIFLGKIKSVLHSLKSNVSDPLNEDRFIFLEQIVHLFTSEDQFCSAYDLYKNFIFRIRPKLSETFNYSI